MTSKFKFRTTKEDLIAFEMFSQKMKRVETRVYILFVLAIVCAVYLYFAFGRDFNYVWPFVAVVLIIGAIFYYTTKIGPKKHVEKIIGQDKNILIEREFTVSPQFIKIETKPQEGEQYMVGVYPYSIMDAVVETEDYIMFFISTKAQILPKRVIPDGMRGDVFGVIRKLPIYRMFDK